MVSSLTRHSLPGFSSAQFAALGTTQHAALGTTQHAALKAFNTSAIAALGSTQISALKAPSTTHEIAALATSQVSALSVSLTTGGLVVLGSTQISALRAADVSALKSASSAQAQASALAQAIGRFAQESQALATSLHFDLSATHAGDAALASVTSVSHLASVLQQCDQQGQLWQASTAVVAGNPSSQSVNSLSGLVQRDGGGIVAIGK